MTLPQFSNDLTELGVVTLILLLLAMFAPLYGAVIALLVVWHADRNSLTVRRNLAVACAALAVFNLVFPSVLYLRLL